MTTIFADRVRDAIAGRKVVADGHTIFMAHAYEPFFTADELREAGLVQTYESDTSDPKSTIFNENGIVEKLEDCVYNLDFLYWLHRKLEIQEPVTMMGRGSQAQQIIEQIIRTIGVKENS